MYTPFVTLVVAETSHLLPGCLLPQEQVSAELVEACNRQ
jgi:hypothetical protein